MKKVLGIIGLTLLLAALLAASVPDARALAHSHAQSMGNVDLLAGEDVTVTCAGDQLVIRPIDAVQVRIDCKGSGNPPPTGIPPTDVPPTMVMPTDTPMPDATLTPTLQATATPVANTPAPTITPPQLPSATPVANTPVPAPTDTPDPHVSIQPYAGAPLCATHDDNAWHGLWDYQNGCHYNHTHNTDPNVGDAIFGVTGALWGGQEISYPWLTSPLENTMKHGGYKYGYREFTNCAPTNSYNGKPANCVVAGRVEYHAVSGLMDWMARFHSFYEEIKVCQRTAPTQCGIVRTGGWADFGILEAAYKELHVVRPGGAIDFGNGMVMSFPPDAPELAGQDVNTEPYLAAPSLANLPFMRSQKPSTSSSRREVWSMGEGKTAYSSPHPFARFLIGIVDSWNVVDPANPNDVIWVCTDPNHNQCPYNGSIQAIQELSAFIPASLDPDGDGFADYSGYTDRHGAIVTGCTAPALDCVPFSVEHAPIGYADSRDGGAGAGLQEFDLSPRGEHWITFPN